MFEYDLIKLNAESTFNGRESNLFIIYVQQNKLTWRRTSK